jgi:hypothetical protein
MRSQGLAAASPGVSKRAGTSPCRYSRPKRHGDVPARLFRLNRVQLLTERLAPNSICHMELAPQDDRTAWHITVGTYGTRLHGADAPTVDRRHNQRGAPFLSPDLERVRVETQLMIDDPLFLEKSHRVFIERTVPEICERGGWHFFTCAAPPPPDNTHVHVLLHAAPSAPPKVIRELLKRWLTQELDSAFGAPPHSAPRWWAEGGSTKPVKNLPYLNNAYHYINRQRTT